MGNCGTLARRAATWTMAPSIRPSTLRATATWKKRRRSAGCGSRGKTRRTSRGLTATPGREGKMDLSQGSDDTRESLSLSMREEEDAKMKKNSRGNDRKPSSKKLSSSSGKKGDMSDRHLNRGRSKRKGGDNAKAYDESGVV